MHGGNIWAAAQKIGCSPQEILDFSASINPLGPPDWVGQLMAENLWQISHYPDPDYLKLKQSAASFYGVNPGKLVIANGASEILSLVPRLFPVRQAVIPVPSYVEYERIANIYGLETKYIYLKEENNFHLDLEELDRTIKTPAFVFLSTPNNPTGQTLEATKLADLIQSHPQNFFIIDEAFADFVPALKRMYSYSLPNVITVISLTKFFALPGLRVGLAIADMALCQQIKNLLPPWSVNFLAQEVASAALRDKKYIRKTLKILPELKEKFISALKTFQELTIFPGQANFILLKLMREDLNAEQLAQKLFSQKILIRVCSNFMGLDARFFRLAIKTHEQNCQLISALKACLCSY